MGAILGSAMKETMDENMKKNQEFMLKTQKMQVWNYSYTISLMALAPTSLL